MKHAAAISQLEIHASNCENNAVIQEREGQFEDAANNRTNAADYRQAIEDLQEE
jgi:signal recognition particle GTPase